MADPSIQPAPRRSRRAMTAAEKQRNYRERLKKSPEKYEQFKKREAERQRERTKNRHWTEEQKAMQRMRWRERVRRHRLKKKAEAQMQARLSQEAWGMSASSSTSEERDAMPWGSLVFLAHNDSCYGSTAVKNECNINDEHTVQMQDQQTTVSSHASLSQWEHVNVSSTLGETKCNLHDEHVTLMQGQISSGNSCVSESLPVNGDVTESNVDTLASLESFPDRWNQCFSNFKLGQDTVLSDALQPPPAQNVNCNCIRRRALTPAERQRKYRERLKQSPEKWEEYKKRDADRRKKNLGQKHLCVEFAAQQRMKATERKRRYRCRKKEGEKEVRDHRKYMHLTPGKTKQLVAERNVRSRKKRRGHDAGDEVKRSSVEQSTITQEQILTAEALIAHRRMKGRERMRKYRLKQKAKAQMDAVSEEPEGSESSKNLLKIGRVWSFAEGGVDSKDSPVLATSSGVTSSNNVSKNCEVSFEKDGDGDRLVKVLPEIEQTEDDSGARDAIPTRSMGHWTILQTKQEQMFLKFLQENSISLSPSSDPVAVPMDDMNNLIRVNIDRVQVSSNRLQQADTGLVFSSAPGAVMVFPQDVVPLPAVADFPVTQGLTAHDRDQSESGKAQAVLAADRLNMNIKQDPDECSLYEQPEQDRLLRTRACTSVEQVQKNMHNNEKDLGVEMQCTRSSPRSCRTSKREVSFLEGHAVNNKEISTQKSKKSVSSEEMERIREKNRERQRRYRERKRGIGVSRDGSYLSSVSPGQKVVPQKRGRPRKASKITAHPVLETGNQFESGGKTKIKRGRPFKQSISISSQACGDRDGSSSGDICESEVVFSNAENIPVVTSREISSQNNHGLDEILQIIPCDPAEVRFDWSELGVSSRSSAAEGDESAGDFTEVSHAILEGNVNEMHCTRSTSKCGHHKIDNHSLEQHVDKNMELPTRRSTNSLHCDQNEELQEEHGWRQKRYRERKNGGKTSMSYKQTEQVRAENRERQRRCRARKKGINSGSLGSVDGVSALGEGGSYSKTHHEGHAESVNWDGLCHEQGVDTQEEVYARIESSTQFRICAGLTTGINRQKLSSTSDGEIVAPREQEMPMKISTSTEEFMLETSNHSALGDKVRKKRGRPRKQNMSTSSQICGDVDGSVRGTGCKSEVVVSSAGNIPVVIKSLEISSRNSLGSGEIPQIIPCDPPEADYYWSELDLSSFSSAGEANSGVGDVEAVSQMIGEEEHGSVSGSARRKAFLPTRHHSTEVTVHAACSPTTLDDVS